MMRPRWWWLPLALARHGPPPRPVADDASGRCPAPRNCSAPPAATGAVHVMASKAGWGGHDNYYHYFYGRLVPLLHWFAATAPGRGDAVVVNDADLRPRELWTPYLLEKVLAPHLCRAAPPRMLHLAQGSKDSAIAAALAAAGLPVGDVRVYPFRDDMDVYMYGCGSLDAAAKATLAAQIDAARRLAVAACGCCARQAGDALVVAVLERHEDQRFSKGGPRTVPNLGDVAAALRDRAAAWASELGAAVDVVHVEFQAMSHCAQWCAVDGAAVVLGQHGAGLANAAFLRGGSAGLVEIASRGWLANKTLFHCVAGLRGSHYGRVLQDSATAPVDVDATLGAVETVLRRAAANATPADRYPDTKLREDMRKHCAPRGRALRAGFSPGWRRRIAC